MLMCPMKSVKYILCLVITICYSVNAFSQFTIERDNVMDFRLLVSDSMKNAPLYNKYFSEAKWRDDKRKIKKERNDIEFNSSFHLSQTQFENWASGGDNTFSGAANIFFRHKYHKDKFAFEYKFSAKYGISVIDAEPFKNMDEFVLNLQTTWNVRKSWAYAASANIRSQFSPGYKSRNEDDILMSNFMSPGFFDVSVGMNYQNDDSPFNITLSPLSGSVVVVISDTLSMKGINGVTKGEHTKGAIGPSVMLSFDKSFIKDKFRFRSHLYAFTNIKVAHTARWENTLEVIASKYFSTKIYGLIYYDSLVDTPYGGGMQYNYSISVGLAYTFKNK